MTSEWTRNKELNPFNSMKVMSQLYKWEQISEGNIVAPTGVTVDPINDCNLKCVWCNAKYVMDKNSNIMKPETMKKLASELKQWGVEAVCIAGGGEPLMHSYTRGFIDDLRNRLIRTGIVTNGTNIRFNLDSLDNCDWVSVSVDAAKPETYKRLKGKNELCDVFHNISLLTNRDSYLNKEGQARGVTYKYLLHPQNVGEVYDAALIAKDLRCRNIHIRPYGNPFDRKLGGEFKEEDLKVFREQIEKARTLEDKTFGVFGITHKFDGNFKKCNEFDKCNAIYMTGVFMPPSKDNMFDYSACCDRRGDPELTKQFYDFKEFRNWWGNEEHKAMKGKINVKECPRCTYQPHNKIYENAIEKDNMSWRFI